jgi:TP901 family phage tail tape measure protein
MGNLSSALKLSLIDNVFSRARFILGDLNNLQRQTSMMSGSMRNLLAFGATNLGVTQRLQTTVGAALSFESAFADVKKVVTASDEQLQGFERSIRRLSTVIPSTAKDLAALYAAGAASGIANNELNAFAEMAARVGIAYDIPMVAAGESLAKLKTQLGLSLSETGSLADAMNHLSNTMASKASDRHAGECYCRAAGIGDAVECARQ